MGGRETESQGNGVNRERQRMGREWDSRPEAQGGKGQGGWHSDWALRRPERWGPEIPNLSSPRVWVLPAWAG